MISIILPTFDNEKIIKKSINSIISFFSLFEIELIIVDDGSSDNTNKILVEFLKSIPYAQLITLKTNCGKGEALRRGIAKSSGDVILFMDSDLSASLENFEMFISNITDFDVIIGSRSVHGSAVKNSDTHRIVMGRLYNSLRRLVFLRSINDSQCGFKIFSGDVGRKLFGISTCNRFSIDIEILRIAEVLNIAILELPVVWKAGNESSIRLFRDSLTMFFELFVLRLKLSRRRVLALAQKWDKEQALES